jgi:hypothetical protein
LNWGWYGLGTTATAYVVLMEEYGPKTAEKYCQRFGREFLANITTDNFVLTSGAIDFIIKKLGKHESTSKTFSKNKLPQAL